MPAGEIERFVVDQIKCVGRDPQLIKETLAQARQTTQEQIDRLKVEHTRLLAQLRSDQAELSQFRTPARNSDPRLEGGIRDKEQRATEIENELATLERDLVDEAEVTKALADFNAVWDGLAPREQVRVIELLVERVAYDGNRGTISITFRASGIRLLVGELAKHREKAA